MALLSTYPRITDPFKQGTHSGLNFAYGVGSVRADNVVTDVAAGTVTLPDDATNYIEITTAGDVSANTTGFTVGSIPLYMAVTASGAITTTDKRCFLSIGGGSSSVGNAADIAVVDAGEYFTGTDAEAVLQEVGKQTNELDSQINTNNSSELWELIGLDIFEDISNWSFYNFETGAVDTNWTVSGNKIKNTLGLAGDFPRVAYFNKSKISDGRIQVVIENPSALNADGKWAGLIIKSKANNNFIMVVLHANTNYNVKVWKYDGLYTQLAYINLIEDDVKFRTGCKYSLEVDIEGNRLKVNINGREIIDITDENILDYMVGKSGLVAQQLYQWEFSNFSLFEKSYDKISKSDTNKILCIGSSITYGYGATTSYPDRLQTKFNQEYNKNTIVINAGISSDTTTMMGARLQALLTAHIPSIVVIETSVNDLKTANVSPAFSFDNTIGNMRKMIKRVKGTGAIPIITTITSLNPNVAGDLNNQSFQWLHQLNNRIRVLAKQEKIRWVENAYAFKNDLTLLTDTVHPNDAGAQIMADTAYNTITRCTQ